MNDAFDGLLLAALRLEREMLAETKRLGVPENVPRSSVPGLLDLEERIRGDLWTDYQGACFKRLHEQVAGGELILSKN